MTWSRIAALVTTALLPMSVLSNELTNDEQAVWDLEKTYWEYVKANDIEKYRSLWDERFIGWPGFSDKPIGKAEIHEWVKQLHADPSAVVDYEITFGSVRAYGDVVAAHYLVRYYRQSKITGARIGDDTVSRITHTWQRNGDTWTIITGMSGTWLGKTGN